MSLNSTQKRIADRIAHLLAESPLDDEMKKVILDGLDKLPEHLVFRLLDSLEREREELKRVTLDIELFLQQQEKTWEKLEENQKALADKFVNKTIRKIEDELKLEETRKSLEE